MVKSKGVGRGRVPGSKNRKTLARLEAAKQEEEARASRRGGRLRAKLEEGLTDEEIMGLSAELKARLLASLQPKEPVQPVGNSFRLVVVGLPGWECEFCGKKQTAKTTPAQEDAPQSTETSSTVSKDAHLPPPKGLPGDFFQEDPEKPEPPVRFSINKDSLDLG
jgi:hypothetical protein